MYANRANLAAVDHLGRKLPDFNECPPTKKEKVVALFYYLWHIMVPRNHSTHLQLIVNVV